MKVTVIAPFPVPGQAPDGALELPRGARVSAIFRGAPVYTAFLPVSVNGQQVSRRKRLKEGDLVVVIAPISGG